MRRGGVYFTLGALVTKIPTKILAIGDESLPRPLIKILVDEVGRSAEHSILINYDLTLEGLRFNGRDVVGRLAEGIIRTLDEGLKITLKDCQFDSIGSEVVYVGNNHCDVFISDCLCYDLGHANYDGRIVDGRSTFMDSLVIVNNTFYNVLHCILNKFGGWERYIKFDHNTVFNLVRCPLRIVQCPDVSVTNNLFIQTGICGYHVKYKYGPDGWTDPLYAYTSRDRFTRIELLPATRDTFSMMGLTQKSNFANNNFWIDPAIDAALPDSGLPYMTIDFDTARQVIGEDTLTWISEDPGFTSTPSVRGIEMAISNLTGQNMFYNPGFDTGNQPYDFTYSESAQSFTAANGEFPLGDLNWFPDKKVQWKQWIATAVEFSNSGVDAPLKFNVEQNYPNPFNPSTNIHYATAISGKVSLSIYNTLGQKVRTLVDEKMAVGSYIATWDGTNDVGMPLSGGIYFYRLKVDNQIVSKKMTFMK